MMVNNRLLQQTKPVQTHLVLAIVAGLLGGVVLVGQAYALSRVVGRVFLHGDSLAGVQFWLWLLLGLSLARAGLTWLGQVLARRVAGRIKTDLRSRLTAHLLALGPAYTRGERSGELANTLVEGVEALDAYFSQYLPQLALAALVPLSILAFVFPLDVVSGLVLLLTAPLIPVFMVLIGNLADSLTRRQWQSLSRMSAHFLDVLQGLTTLKLLGRSREQAETIAFISNRFRQTTMRVLRVAFLSALVLELVATLSTAVVAVQVGLRLLYGYLAFEQAFFVLVLAPEFYLPLRLLGTRFHAGMSGMAAARRIFELLDTPRPEPGGPAKISRLHPPLTINFHNVGYRYRAGERPALNGVSFTLDADRQVALVGPSGAGKSTVAQLLLGFIRPTAGAITVNGRPLAEIDPDVWRAQLAWVPQQPYLFNTSVADNIRLARPGAGLDDVKRAARLAHADAFIEALPQGYHTPIGERGIRLSGGQAQRLALARAFLKDAPVLILDEATAHLDPDHEARIQAAINRLVQGRTTLIIAHRLNTVYQAQTILVMDGGKIVESGTHGRLLAQNGLYHRLVTACGIPPVSS